MSNIEKNVILVCGGRDFIEIKKLAAVLDNLHQKRPFSLLLHGGASGADCFANKWAVFNEIPHKVYKAKWGTYGRAAGPLRNAEMLKENDVDLVVAFPGGKGTANMIKLAKAKGIDVMEIL